MYGERNIRKAGRESYCIDYTLSLRGIGALLLGLLNNMRYLSLFLILLERHQVSDIGICGILVKLEYKFSECRGEYHRDLSQFSTVSTVSTF